MHNHPAWISKLRWHTPKPKYKITAKNGNKTVVKGDGEDNEDGGKDET